MKFVPASGAASRMFKNLAHYQRGPGRERSWASILSESERGAGEAQAPVIPLKARAKRRAVGPGFEIGGII